MTTKKLKQTDVVLLALAASGGDSYTPVQLQKMMFLLDKNLPERIGAPFFGFEPYHYGAFDSNVYTVASELATQNLVLIDLNPGSPIRTYATTQAGRIKGEKILNSFEQSVSEYVKEVSAWVRSLSFAQLVREMYEAYPETKANSVFR